PIPGPLLVVPSARAPCWSRRGHRSRGRRGHSSFEGEHAAIRTPLSCRGCPAVLVCFTGNIAVTTAVAGRGAQPVAANGPRRGLPRTAPPRRPRRPFLARGHAAPAAPTPRPAIDPPSAHPAARARPAPR